MIQFKRTDTVRFIVGMCVKWMKVAFRNGILIIELQCFAKIFEFRSGMIKRKKCLETRTRLKFFFACLHYASFDYHFVVVDSCAKKKLFCFFFFVNIEKFLIELIIMLSNLFRKIFYTHRYIFKKKKVCSKNLASHKEYTKQ